VNVSEVLELVLFFAALQFSITFAVATFDIWIVWFGVWIPMRREIAPADRKYVWRGVAEYARAAREGAEAQARLRRQEEQRAGR
jgi:hypothetical protein